MTNRTSNRVCIALGLATAAVIAYALACTAATIPVALPDGGTLHIRAERVKGHLRPVVLGELSNILPATPDGLSHEDELAYNAANGNEVWRRVRNTQQAYNWTWVQAYIEPPANCRLYRIYWDKDQVVVFVAGSTVITCLEVLAFKTGRASDPLKLVCLFPHGWRGFADDLRVWYKSVGDAQWMKRDVVIAFPPMGTRRWWSDDVEDIIVGFAERGTE